MTEMGALRVLAYSGGEWVIDLLLVCSVLTVAVVIERFVVQRRERQGFLRVSAEVTPLLEKGDLAVAGAAASGVPGAAARILAAGLAGASSGVAAAEERLASARLTERRRLERRLVILGTLGNNAPFIGLFGTVLGVIKAFHDLAETSSAGPEVVMQGLSEALIATAVGLLVAIPSVMAYNYFQKRANDLLTDTEALARLLMARLKARP